MSKNEFETKSEIGILKERLDIAGRRIEVLSDTIKILNDTIEKQGQNIKLLKKLVNEKDRVIQHSLMWVNGKPKHNKID